MEWALTVTKANTERMIELVENLFTLSSDKECDMNDIIDITRCFHTAYLMSLQHKSTAGIYRLQCRFLMI